MNVFFNRETSLRPTSLFPSGHESRDDRRTILKCLEK